MGLYSAAIGCLTASSLLCLVCCKPPPQFSQLEAYYEHLYSQSIARAKGQVGDSAQVSVTVNTGDITGTAVETTVKKPAREGSAGVPPVDDNVQHFSTDFSDMVSHMAAKGMDPSRVPGLNGEKQGNLMPEAGPVFDKETNSSTSLPIALRGPDVAHLEQLKSFRSMRDASMSLRLDSMKFGPFQGWHTRFADREDKREVRRIQENLVPTSDVAEGNVKLPPVANIEEAYILAIPNAYVTVEGLIMDEKHAYGPIDSFFGKLPKQEEHVAVSVYNKLAVFLYRWSFAFQCFVTDSLPRIVYMLDFLKKETDVSVLVEGSAVQLEFLRLLGIDSSRIVTVPSGENRHFQFFQAKTAYTVRYSPFEGFGNLPHELAMKMHLSISPEVPCYTRDKVLYVSREGKRRAVSNKDQLFFSLQELPLIFNGQLSVLMYGTRPLPVTEAVELFQHSMLMVGPHGGGMANAVFMNANSAVVEFVVKDSYNYEPLMRAMQHEYYAVPGVLPVEIENNGQGHEAAMTIDVRKVSALVECLINSEKFSRSPMCNDQRTSHSHCGVL